MAPSPALTSRVTPRSTKKWKPSWKSPKSPYPGPTKRSPKASANFRNVPSTSPYRSPQNKGAYSPTPNPKALVDRLSPSTYTGTQSAPEPPPSPTKWLDTLMQSKTLTAMLSSGKDVSNDASGDMNHDVVKQPAVSAADNTEESPISPLATVIPSAAPEDQQPTSPMSSTSAADVDEILRAVPDSDQINFEMPTAVPNSPVDSPAVIVAAAAPVSLYERCRRLILPLAIQNARARHTDTNGDSAVVESEQVERQVITSMTDKICVDFMSTAKEVKQQMAALKKDSDGRGESIVGAKRPRDEAYSTEGSVTNRVRLDSNGAESAMSIMPPPRAPKAMILAKQNEVLDKFMPMLTPHTDSKAPVSPTRINHATPPPSQEPKYSGRPPTSDRRESDYDMDTDMPGCRRDHEGDIEHRRDRSHDMDKSKHHRDGKSRNKDHGRRDSRYSDHMDRSDSRRRDFTDVGTRQLNSGRKDADSDLDKLDRRRHDRSDKEWNYVYDHRDSDSSSKKHSSSGSSRQHSHELLASRIPDPEVPTSTTNSTRESSSAGSSCRVPGLWFVKVGLNHLDVVNMTFEVDAEVASRCRGHNVSNIAVRLVCLPTASVEETYKQLDPAASAEVVTDAMRSVKPEWPPKGKIIIEVNPGTKVGRSWLPQDLDSAKPILELTAHIQPGQNNIRLIHLGDLSTHTFLLHATEAQPSSLLAGPTPKPISSKDLLDSDWENYITRLQGIKHSDIRGSAFKFAGTIAVEAQTTFVEWDETGTIQMAIRTQ